MTVSEYIWDYLQKKGLETVYMVSGSSAMWLTDALYKNTCLKAICTHHEQVAAMAADGYGRVHEIPGACLVTIGPGATNAITGVAQAYLDSSPMFIVSGQASSKLLKYEKESGIRQHGTQSLNLEPIVSSITKYFKEIMSPEEIVSSMDEAWVAAIEGRKGPVWIDVPVDIQNRQIPEDLLNNSHEDISKLEAVLPDDKDISEIISHLQSSKRPMILAGYGVRSADAIDLLQEFAKRNNIPVATSRGGIDIIASDDPLFVGRPGAYGDRASHFAIQKCDMLFVLGSRLSVSTIGYYPKDLAKDAYKVMVDIDEKELDKEDVPIDLKVHGDLKEFFKRLLKADFVDEPERFDWIRQCKEWKDKYPNVLPQYKDEKPLNAYSVTDILSKQIDKNATVVVDTGSVCNIVSQSFRIKEGQRYLISGGLSCMGFWATAIGTTKPGCDTIAIAGDGSTQMNVQEFATLKYNNLPIKLFIYQNHGYMLIRHNQHNYMEDRFLGVGPDSGLETPDFCQVARAYGLPSVRITVEDDVEDNIKKVLAMDGPVICEVMVQEFAPIEPRIASRVMPDGSLKAAAFDDLYPFLDEEE